MMPFDAYAGVPVLVLGATGFIGRRVVELLAAHGAVVTAAGRDGSALARLKQATGVETASCDVARADDVATLIRRVEPAVTFNLAGYGVDRTERDEEAALRINGVLPGRLAEVIEPAPAREWRGLSLVHVGSALEYGDAKGDLNEDTAAQPTTLYGRTKLAGTAALATRCRETGLGAVTARLFTVYGPGEHAGRLLPALLEAARTARSLELTAGAQRRDFTYVDDVAEGLLRLALAAAEPGSIVNLATGTLESVRGFAWRAARVLGIEPAALQFGAVPTRAEEMSHDPVAIDRLRVLTGWTPATTIEEGVRKTMLESGTGVAFGARV